MLRKAAILSVYISAPLYVIVYILTYRAGVFIPLVGEIYYPSAFIVVTFSKNPHSINLLFDLIITFIQTYVMIFLTVIIVLYVKAYLSKFGNR
jgi:hypothetical protein